MRLRRWVALAALAAGLLFSSACSSEAEQLNEAGLASYGEGDYQAAADSFGKAIVADNQNPDYYVNQGMAYLELEDYDSAQSCFDSALRLDGSCQGAYRGKGIAYMEAERYDEAVNALNAALACESGRVSEAEYDILLYRGEAQMRGGDYDGAIETYTVLLETKGEESQTYYLRGAANIGKGDIEAGTADMDRAVQLSPADYSLYLNCYYRLAAADQTEAGVQYLQNALTIADNTAGSHKYRGMVHFLLGDYSAALAEFEYVQDNADVETLIYIGLCYQAQGDAESCAQALSRALEQGGENPDVYYQMGMCMFSMEDYEESLDYLSRGLALDGGSYRREMLYMQALCYERLDRFSEALSAFESYVALYGASDELEKEMAFLRTR